MVNLELLNKIEMFKGLYDDQLTAIQNSCSEIKFNRGDKLFSQGDPATHLWIVFEGQVDMRLELPGSKPTSTDNTVYSVSANPSGNIIFGWSCFVAPYKMRLSAYCVSRHCKVIKISKNGLVTLFKNDPRAGYLVMSYIVTVVGGRFHVLQEKVAKGMGEKLMSGW
ncbi:Crp/Fnr family transcriptional regulator [Thermodesulfobacteriota bacterium]